MKLFSNKSAGIDISDRTIEVAEIKSEQGKIKILGLGRVNIIPGLVERGRIKDEEALVEAVEEAFARATPNPIEVDEIVFGLPESVTYTHVFKFEPHSKKEQEELVLKKIKANVPLEESDLLFSYRVLHEDKEWVEILLVAVSREVVLEWQSFFSKIGIEVNTFDIEALATFRGLFSELPKDPVCLIDIGTASSSLAFFDESGLRHSYSINVAGDDFTKEIALALKVDEEKADELKKKIGLSKPGDQVCSACIKSLQPVLEEIRTAVDYFYKKTGKKVSQIVLVGGSSKLKGLTDYFSTNLDLPVVVGKSSLSRGQVSLEYVEAVGIAFRGLDKNWQQTDPAIELKVGKIKKMDTQDITNKESAKSEKNWFKKWQEKGQKKEENMSRETLNIDTKAKKRVRAKQIMLVSVVVFGLIVIPYAFFYRNNNRNQNVVISVSQTEITDIATGENEVDFSDTVGLGVNIEQDLIVETPPEAPNESKATITITETPTGWLNVREGPGTSYFKVTKVLPGESYPLLEEAKNWYKIEINRETLGWVFSGYVQKD